MLDPSGAGEPGNGIRTQVDITTWIAYEGGVDWGDAAVENYMAEAQRGALPVDFRIPNRQIQIPLKLRTVGATTFATIRNNVQAKVALFQAEGGWLKRTTDSGTYFLDIVSATLKYGGSGFQAYKGFDVDAMLSLEAIPDFYGAEVDLGDNTSIVNGCLVFTDTGVTGNYPGRLRVVVDNDSATNHLGLLWGIRSRYYSSSAAARLHYPETELTAMASSLSTNWTPLWSTNRDSGTAPTGALVHTGTYRVWAVMDATTTNPIVDLSVRLVWDVGDMTFPIENAPAPLTANGNVYSVDLGEVQLSPSPSGTHRWQGIIQGKGVTGGEVVFLTYLYLVPVNEGYGVLRASTVGDIGIVAHSARDEFNQSAGSLAAKVAPVGGTWTGAGDADDFTIDTSGKTAQRTAVSDSAATNGRFGILGSTNYTNIAVQVNVKRTNVSSNTWTGVLARTTDADNFFIAAIVGSAVQAPYLITQAELAGSPVSGVGYVAPLPFAYGANQWATIQIFIDATGRFYVYAFPAGAVPYGSTTAVIAGRASQLATGGGTLASGKPGIYDSHTDATANTRNFDNIAAWVPVYDAVIYPSQSAELRTEGMFREDSTGAGWGPVTSVTGDLPRIPASGLEGRTVEMFFKGSQGNFTGQVADLGTGEAISARPFYRPSWVTVPGS